MRRVGARHLSPPPPIPLPSRKDDHPDPVTPSHSRVQRAAARRLSHPPLTSPPRTPRESKVFHTNARYLASPPPTSPFNPFEDQVHRVGARRDSSTLPPTQRNSQVHRMGERTSPPPPASPHLNPFESQLRRVGAGRSTPPPAPTPAPAPAWRPGSPRIGSGRCRIDISKAEDYYLDMEAMKSNVATVNAPPVDDYDDIRYIQQCKRFRAYLEEYLKWQLQQELLRIYIRETKDKERAQETLSQQYDSRPMPSPRQGDDQGRNGLHPSTYTYDAGSLLAQYTAEEFAYESTLNNVRQIQARENPSTLLLDPNYSQASSSGTQVSRSRDISPPAHLLPSNLFSESPPPPMISEASHTSALTDEDLCQNLEPVDESTLKEAFKIFNMATNINKYTEKYKAIEPPTVPVQEITPVVQDNKSPNEKHIDDLRFQFNEIFKCAKSTQNNLVKENQYLQPLTLNLEPNQYAARDNRVELTPLTLEYNQYDIRNNRVQQNSYITPMTPSFDLGRNLAITREPTHTPLLTPRPQPIFSNLNTNLMSAQPIEETQPYQLSSIAFTSAQLSPYELFCTEFDAQPITTPTLDFEQSNLQWTASYFSRGIDYDRNNAETPWNIKPDQNMKDNLHRIDEAVKQRKWSLLPYWTYDNTEGAAKAAVEPADEISKEIEDAFNTLTISDEIVEIPESPPALDDITDWASISPIWSYKKEDKTIDDRNPQYEELNELLSLTDGKEDESKASGSRNDPNNEYQFLLIPSEESKDSKEQSIVIPNVVEHEESKETNSQCDVKKNKQLNKLSCDSEDQTVHLQTPPEKGHQPINKPTVKSSEKSVHTEPNESKIAKDPIKIRATKKTTQESEDPDISSNVSKDTTQKNKNKYTKVSKIDKKLFDNPNRLETKVDYKEMTARKAKGEGTTKGRRKSKHMKNTKGRKSKKK